MVASQSRRVGRLLIYRFHELWIMCCASCIVYHALCICCSHSRIHTCPVQPCVTAESTVLLHSATGCIIQLLHRTRYVLSALYCVQLCLHEILSVQVVAPILMRRVFGEPQFCPTSISPITICLIAKMGTENAPQENSPFRKSRLPDKIPLCATEKFN